MRSLAALLMAAALFIPAAHAEKIDLSTIKCQEFMSSSKDNIGIILAWLDGYYKENNAPPIFDSDKFKKDSENLAKYCADHPTAGLITAADETLGK